MRQRQYDQDVISGLKINRTVQIRMPDQYACTEGDFKVEVQRIDTNEQHLAANVVSLKAGSIPVARYLSSVNTCRVITTTEI